MINICFHRPGTIWFYHTFAFATTKVDDFMPSKNKDDNNDYFESKDKKIEVNEWRKLIIIIIAGLTLYVLLTYNIFDYTGNLIGVLLLLIWARIINYIVTKLFGFFIK